MNAQSAGRNDFCKPFLVERLAEQNVVTQRGISNPRVLGALLKCDGEMQVVGIGTSD